MIRLEPVLGGDAPVYRANLDAHPGLAGLLSQDERGRARRFRRRIDHDRYVAARGLLRQLVAERTGRAPAAIRLVDGAHGKPRLEEPAGFAFNLSHSGAEAIFAFSARGEVGVDVEAVRPIDPLRLSLTCFSAREREQLRRMDDAERLAAFFDGWVRKEAVIKADGRGVSLGLDTFSVSLDSDARLLEAPPGDDPGRWSLRRIDLGPGLRAAIAVRS